MAFVKQTLSPFSTRAADPLFDFEEPYIQYGVISGQSYTANQVSYGLPKPSYLQIAENSAVVTVVASADEPVRVVFALGKHDANTGGEVGAWRSFTGKSASNNTVTVSVTGSAWVYAEINENGEPNNPNAWTITYAHETSAGKTYTTSTTEPTSPTDGDVWFDVTNNKLFKYNNSLTQWEYKKRVYLGEVGVGTDGYLYTVQSWYPNRGYADYEDSFYPYYENPWRHYDGVSFTTNGQYTAAEASNWANNATIGQAVTGNRIAMEAVANSTAAMTSLSTEANTYTYFANSTIAATASLANTTTLALVANSSGAMQSVANSSVGVNVYFNSAPAMTVFGNDPVSSQNFAEAPANVRSALIANTTGVAAILSTNAGASCLMSSATITPDLANNYVAMSSLSSAALSNDTYDAIATSTTAKNSIRDASNSIYRRAFFDNATLIRRQYTCGNIAFGCRSPAVNWTPISGAGGHPCSYYGGASGPSGLETFYCAAGPYTFVVPPCVNSISVIMIGGGGGGGGAHGPSGSDSGGGGGGGGGLAWKNNIPVTAGQSIAVCVGAGGAGGQNNSWGDLGGDSFVCVSPTECYVACGGGQGRGTGDIAPGGAGGGYSPNVDGGGTGGSGGKGAYSADGGIATAGGGGGTAGYGGNGGVGAGRCPSPGAVILYSTAGTSGGGGGGDHRTTAGTHAGNGGGGNVFGKGCSGPAIPTPERNTGTGGYFGSNGYSNGATGGGCFGGGGAGIKGPSGAQAYNGAIGAVRIIYPGSARQFSDELCNPTTVSI